MSPNPETVVERLREELRAFAHDLRWYGHTEEAARAEAIANKYGVTDAAA